MRSLILGTNTVVFMTNQVSQSVSQFRDIPETVQRQTRDSSETVQIQFRDGLETVQRQSRDCPETVQRLSRDSPGTVRVPPKLDNLRIFKGQSDVRTVKSETTKQTTMQI